jgi:hypothetical protein
LSCVDDAPQFLWDSTSWSFASSSFFGLALLRAKSLPKPQKPRKIFIMFCFTHSSLSSAKLIALAIVLCGSCNSSLFVNGEGGHDEHEGEDEHHDDDEHDDGMFWKLCLLSLVVNLMTLGGVVFVIPAIQKLKIVKPTSEAIQPVEGGGQKPLVTSTSPRINPTFMLISTAFSAGAILSTAVNLLLLESSHLIAAGLASKEEEGDDHDDHEEGGHRLLRFATRFLEENEEGHEEGHEEEEGGHDDHEGHGDNEGMVTARWGACLLAGILLPYFMGYLIHMISYYYGNKHAEVEDDAVVTEIEMIEGSKEDVEAGTSKEVQVSTHASKAAILRLQASILLGDAFHNFVVSATPTLCPFPKLCNLTLLLSTHPLNTRYSRSHAGRLFPCMDR